MQLTSPTAVAITIAASLFSAQQSIVAASTFNALDVLDSYLAANHIVTSPLASVNRQQSTIANSNLESILDTIKTPSSTELNSARSRCPVSCNDAGSNPNDWTVYHDGGRLALCNDTMLLDFSIYNPLNDFSNHASIRSCTADSDADSDTNVIAVRNPVRRDGSCYSGGNQTQVKASLQMAWIDSTNPGNVDNIVAAAQQPQSYLIEKGTDCNKPIVC